MSRCQQTKSPEHGDNVAPTFPRTYETLMSSMGEEVDKEPVVNPNEIQSTGEDNEQMYAEIDDEREYAYANSEVKDEVNEENQESSNTDNGAGANPTNSEFYSYADFKPKLQTPVIATSYANSTVAR